MTKSGQAYKFAKHSLIRYIRCWICSLPPEQQQYIPIKKWASDNNYTIRQCEGLLLSGRLMGAKYGNRYYVMENPEWSDLVE